MFREDRSLVHSCERRYGPGRLFSAESFTGTGNSQRALPALPRHLADNLVPILAIVKQLSNVDIGYPKLRGAQQYHKRRG